jgi:hypothetical protein
MQKPYKKFEEYNIKVTHDVKNRCKQIIEDLDEYMTRDELLKTQNVLQKQNSATTTT